MIFILGLLLDYGIRGKKPLLIATLALSQLAISVRRERLSRPPQTTETKLRDANLNIRVLANRHDLPLEPYLIATQTPQAGERVDWDTVIGVTISAERPEWMR
jgi:hypothetical protein